MAKLKLNEKQILAGIRYLNTKSGRDEYNLEGRYQFEDMFEAMGITIDGMPPLEDFGDSTESPKPEEMSTGFAQNLFDNINKV